MSQAMRTASVHRKTSETDIAVEVNLDGSGSYRIATGIGFLDHMLEQLSRHSLIDIEPDARPATSISTSTTPPRIPRIALGEAFAKALGDRRGIARFGHAYAPMDETLTRVRDRHFGPALLGLAGRSSARRKLGELDTELFEHWFHSFAQAAGITLHVETLYGAQQPPYRREQLQGGSRARCAQAVEIDPRKGDAIPSTKGTLRRPCLTANG